MQSRVDVHANFTFCWTLRSAKILVIKTPQFALSMHSPCKGALSIYDCLAF